MGLVLDSRLLLETIGTTALLVGAWLGLLAVRARLSGWASLAGRYRAHERPEGPEFRRQGARLHGCHFRRGVTVRTSSRGLYLELTRPWRFQHPPLLIPWAHLSGPKPDTTFLGHRRFEFILSEHPACTVRLGEHAALEAKQYLPIPRMRYAETPPGVRPRAEDADVMSRPREPSRTPAALDQLGGRPAAVSAGSGQWLVACICGWTTRAPSSVAADAAVIVHQRQASSLSEHVTAYSRYHDPLPCEQKHQRHARTHVGTSAAAASTVTPAR